MKSDGFVKQVNSLQKLLQQNSEQASKYERQPHEKTQAKRPILIASIDTFHRMSGIINKLKAYYSFLQDYPGYRN